MSEDMSERMPERMSEIVSEKDVRRYVRKECQKICPKKCHKEGLYWTVSIELQAPRRLKTDVACYISLANSFISIKS